jgi:hypothetical protein
MLFAAVTGSDYEGAVDDSSDGTMAMGIGAVDAGWGIHHRGLSRFAHALTKRAIVFADDCFCSLLLALIFTSQLIKTFSGNLLG